MNRLGCSPLEEGAGRGQRNSQESGASPAVKKQADSLLAEISG